MAYQSLCIAGVVSSSLVNEIKKENAEAFATPCRGADIITIRRIINLFCPSSRLGLLLFQRPLAIEPSNPTLTPIPFHKLVPENTTHNPLDQKDGTNGFRTPYGLCVTL